MIKKEYDFLVWTSFPSSIRLFNDEERAWSWYAYAPERLQVLPNATVKTQIESKIKDVGLSPSHYAVDGWNGASWRRITSIHIGKGNIDWKTYSREFTVPSDIEVIRGAPAGGAGSKESPGVTWYDDLRIYQDGVLIYTNDFTEPLTGSLMKLGLGLTPVVAVSAVVGASELQKAGVIP